MNIAKILIKVYVVSLLAMFSSCDNEPEGQNKETIYLQRLNASWNTQSVKVDGVVVTDAFKDMVVMLNADKTFTVVNPVSPIWPTSGSFTLEKNSSNDHYTLKRDDGINIMINDLSTSTIRYTLQYEVHDGRQSSVGGEYTFEMYK